MKSAIVTGATGTLGTALLSELIKNNIKVLVLCRKESKRNSLIPSSDLVEIRYCSLEEFEKIDNIKDEHYDIFFHLAWNGTTGAERENLYLQNLNVKYAMDAVALAKRFNCSVFVGAGSQAEYGRCNMKLDENTAVNPESGYGIAKFSAGYMTRRYAQKLGLKHIWVRILSLYGPNDNPNSLIMTLINKLKIGESPKLTLCEQTWDYLYSADAANAFYRLAEGGKSGKIYVLGSGETHPLKDYATMVRDKLAPRVNLNFGAIPYTKEQVMHLCADISELEKDVGWTPKTSFNDGIDKILKK